MPLKLNPVTGEFDLVMGPGTGTATIQFDADSGSATPTGGGVITVSGGLGLTTSATGTVVTFAIDTPVIVGNGGTGQTTYADGQLLIGNSTGNTLDKASLTAGAGITITPGSGAITIALAGGAIGIDSLKPDSGTDPVVPDGAGLVSIVGDGSTTTSVGGLNTLTIQPTADFEETGMHGWNGSLLETASVVVTSDGATITLSVQLNGGGDLTAVFSDGYYDWDTTPAATVTLTAGTDTSPQINYIYFLQSTKTLTSNTSDFPTVEHAPIATVICQSAASLQGDGAYKVHVWTDELIDPTSQGHVHDLNSWIRNQNATWIDGVAQTFTITTNGGAADNVILTTASGNILQLHSHAFPVFSGTPDIYVVNDNATPYNKVTDLNALLTDSTGASMSGKFFSLVIWGSVAEDTGDAKLYCNLPGGSYNSATFVSRDADRLANFSIPADFKGTAFLIAQWNLRHQVAASGTWTSIDEIDLRGLEPSIFPGGTNAFPTEFEDNVFRVLDDGDNTKELAFQCSGITTATTRTMTVPNLDGTLVVSNEASTDNAVARYDSTTGKLIQNSVVTVTDGGICSGITQLNVDNLRLDGNTASSTDTNGDIILSPDGTGGVVAVTSLTVGDSVKDVDFTINGAALSAVSAFHTSGVTDLGGVIEERHSETAAFGAHTLFLRTRGTEGSSTVVADNDVIARLVGAGYDGTDFAQSAEIRMEIDGTPGADDMPGRLVFLTSADGAQTPIEALRIDSSQVITLANALTVVNGGTGATTLTDGGVLLGSGTGAITPLGQATNGQLVIGSTSADPVLGNITSTDGTLTVTNGAGTLVIEGTAASATQAGVIEMATDAETNTGTATDRALTPANITAWTGGTALVTVGTIATGVWNGTDIAAADGGTGRSSHTAYAVICGGTTTTTAQQSIASVGTSGQVLTSNGAGALPTMQDAGGGGGADWTLITTVDTSSGGTKTVTSGLGTAYEEYRIVFNDIGLSSSNATFSIAFSADAGSSYTLECQGINLISAGPFSDSSLDSSPIFSNLLVNGYIYFTGNKEAFNKDFICVINEANSGTSLADTESYLGVIVTALDIDALQFSTSTGDFDAGSIVIYGR